MIIIFKLAELNPPQTLSQSISFLPFRIKSRANIDTIKLSRNLFFRGTPCEILSYLPLSVNYIARYLRDIFVTIDLSRRSLLF